jgi:hypothetical protein
MPGPGVVLVRTRDRSEYQPALVDPKAFFAPELPESNTPRRMPAYGDRDKVETFGGPISQIDYEAIVLVNPAPDSEPLQLSATVVRGTPRRVSLFDPDGKPVVGVRPHGIVSNYYSSAQPLRTASFSLTRLHPDRVRRITFFEDARKLIAFLPASGDGDSPYRVQMQPWGTVTGRIVDDNGNPVKATLSVPNWSSGGNIDPAIGVFSPTATNAQGHYRIDKLVPGLRYTAQIHLKGNRLIGSAFEKLVLKPGESRDFGELSVGTGPLAGVAFQQQLVLGAATLRGIDDISATK